MNESASTLLRRGKSSCAYQRQPVDFFQVREPVPAARENNAKKGPVKSDSSLHSPTLTIFDTGRVNTAVLSAATAIETMCRVRTSHLAQA